MNLCIRVVVYSCVYSLVCIHAYVYLRMCIRACVFACMFPRACVFVHVYSCASNHSWVIAGLCGCFVCVHVYLCVYTQYYMSICVLMFVCALVFKYVVFLCAFWNWPTISRCKSSISAAAQTFCVRKRPTDLQNEWNADFWFYSDLKYNSFTIALLCQCTSVILLILFSFCLPSFLCLG